MISIIIPVYNSEHILETCVKSILQQEYRNIEVILVDDGSKDRSPGICEELAKQDHRIKVIHKDNGGISSARNQGLDIATGEWITFCDNDDLVSPNWLKHLINLVERSESILPICAFIRDKSEVGKEKPIERLEAKKTYPISEYLSFYEKQLAGFVWNSLYRKDIIEKYHIRFPERREIGDVNEDLIFQIQYLPHVQGIAYTGYNDYLWAQNETNHSNETTEKWYFEKYEEKYRLLRSWVNMFPSESDRQMKRLATLMLFHFVYAISHERNYNIFKMYIKNSSLQECIRMADCSKESPKVIHLIKKQNALLLWLLLKIT